MKKLKVLVAMSGGVDSSVAALMMKRKGFEVIGVFMKNYSDSKNEITGNCIWKDERKMAIKIASKLGIPLITLDSEEEYKKKVIEKMFRNYKRGFTPNPDIDCNQKIKFPVLIKTAKTLGCNFVVTGHYARIKKIAVENNKNVRFTSFRSQIKDVNNKTSEYSYSGSVANNSSLGGW
ncbi:MAG TPA: tRNA 2-thiouridine(34) synthase MnmA, partial [Candidatus Nanoarchaeia archaeon]|nr:tRNA 2-thiouridine(34) synthase MnmA [Candidatus Nanoarchaeia archaeon]